ncbi:MAG: hypothetical protein COB53_11120 [Elusimicrobia bacterium]|nr:MAG: hypothetical protein COB53_11120 [Elusimicrobiota bacterium]
MLRDEGMWTFDNPPTHLLKKYYGFTPSRAWLNKVRLAALRFNDGGSGSFVSKTGLVLTNHHVGMGQLHKLSTKRRNLVRDGFLAKSQRAELHCPDLEVNQLVGIDNVTRQVVGSLRGLSAKKANTLRKAAIAKIEQTASKKTGLRCDVVELYQGGEYWLYRYKKHTDVRLVQAPEATTAFFGGDNDNFCYPRWAMDFTFFRVYENGKPVRPKHYLPLYAPGAKEGDLTFVIGHPGSTDRLLTTAQLRYQRDIAMPKRLKMYDVRRISLEAFAQKSNEHRRRAQDYRFDIENAIKVVTGEYEALRDSPVLPLKEREEKEFKKKAGKFAKGAWDRIERLNKTLEKKNLALTFRRISGYHLPGFAHTIQRLVVEVEKPNEKRLEEYRESGLDSLKHQLFSPAPWYKDLEEHMLAAGLLESLNHLGPRDAFIKAALQGKSPEAVAKAAITKTRIGDPAFRKELVAGGSKAVAASKDPLILLTRRVDKILRDQRKWFEDKIESVERIEGDRIAKARFKIFGKKIYPDATFTLRFAYGRPLGYAWDKTFVPYKTTFNGLFDRAESFDHKPPWNLPKKVLRAKKKLDLDIPINFVSTHDITGGNSGSPVIDRKARLVGLIFDGNIQSMASSYSYSLENARAVSVHAGGILEALKSIYGAHALIAELKRS